MNKGQLIAAIEGRLGGKKAAADALEAVLDVIIREVAKGRKVGITGFGTFERAARAARTGRNPRTGASVKIKKTAVPKFKAGTAFRTVVADPRQLPKTCTSGVCECDGTSIPTNPICQSSDGIALAKALAADHRTLSAACAKAVSVAQKASDEASADLQIGRAHV